VQLQTVRFFAAGEDVASAAAVKKLRDLSGAPLMDCKAALKNPTVQGDLQKALDWLRAKGIAKATSGNREAKEGLIGIYQNNNQVSLVEVNCETDFVAMNKDFQNFVGLVCQTIQQHNLGKSGSFATNDILALKPTVAATDKQYSNLQEKLGDIISTIRENIVVKRGKTITADANSQVLASYVHGKVATQENLQLGKAASVVQFGITNLPAGKSFESFSQEFLNNVGKKLAMHVVASKPMYLNKSSVPKEFVEKELAIFKEQITDADRKKPAHILDKILDGKVNKRLSEVSLLDQVSYLFSFFSFLVI
jgi:elongation factor Ts